MNELRVLSIVRPPRSQWTRPFLNVPLTQNAPKHTDTRYPLPDFYLQNTCKFACTSRSVDHRVGHGSHADKCQSLHASFPSGTLERGLCCPRSGAWQTERKYTCRRMPGGRSKVTENL